MVRAGSGRPKSSLPDRNELLERSLFIKVGSAIGKVDLAFLPQDRTIALNESSWSLHTSEDYLRAFLDSRGDQFGKVVLYHNFPKRLRRFIGSLDPGLHERVVTVAEL